MLMLRRVFGAAERAGQRANRLWTGTPALARRAATSATAEGDDAVDKRYIDRLVVVVQAGKGGSGSSSLAMKSHRGARNLVGGSRYWFDYSNGGSK